MATASLRRAALLIGIAIAGSTQPAWGRAPAADTPLIIRHAPAGIAATLTELDAKGSLVMLGWTERAGSNVEARYGGSADGGVNPVFGDIWSGHAGPRAVVCPFPLIQAGVTTYPGPDGHRAFQLLAGIATRKVEEPGTDYLRPDVACVGADRIAAVVLVKRKTGTRLTMWLFKPDLTDGARFGFDLGPASPGVNPVVVASAGWIHVAWMSGRSLRYKRYKVGPAPGFVVTPKPTLVIETTSGQGGPVLGVDGKRVVLAWQRKGNAVVRVSTDRGAHFRARKTLLRGSPATADVAFATNADAQGRMLMVSATLVHEGISADGQVWTSTDDGATWKSQMAFRRDQGFLFGALGTVGSVTRVFGTVDWRLADPAEGDHSLILYHRDLP